MKPSPIDKATKPVVPGPGPSPKRKPKRQRWLPFYAQRLSEMHAAALAVGRAAKHLREARGIQALMASRTALNAEISTILRVTGTHLREIERRLDRELRGVRPATKQHKPAPAAKVQREQK